MTADEMDGVDSNLIRGWVVTNNLQVSHEKMITRYDNKAAGFSHWDHKNTEGFFKDRHLRC